jgi:gamma-glutamylcyclotransferase (GGCT)/AIG2-like uncharacterized protein YtfP
MTARLFVYGSLLSGQPAHPLLAGARFLGPARTAAGFELVDLGEYPALLRAGEAQVLGELYEVSAEILAAVDVYEGCPEIYARQRIELDGGAPADAYVMSSEAHARGLPRVTSGDWRARRS